MRIAIAGISHETNTYCRDLTQANDFHQARGERVLLGRGTQTSVGGALAACASLVNLSASIKELPYAAWGAELSSSYHGRATIMSWREAFTVAGSLAAATAPVIILFLGYQKPEQAAVAPARC